ncbi:MAG: hypothetical protein JWN00_2575 [Actinomycetia bacterium]|nr:hypothetical protein [Actinomycetes bacterium]
MNDGPYPPAGEPGQPADPQHQPGWAQPQWAPPGMPPMPPPPPGMPGGTTPQPFQQPFQQPLQQPLQQPGYGTPPPFQQPAWPGQPPYPGYPGQPGFGPGYPPPPLAPPGKKRTGLIIGGVLGGGVLVIVVAVAILAAIGVFAPQPPSPTALLAKAAQRLSAQRGLKYHGTVTSGSDNLAGDFAVTSGGRASASVTWGTSSIQLISLDGNVFVKGDQSFWSPLTKYNPKSDGNPVDGTRWGRLPSALLTFDFKQNLTPALLAAQLRRVTKTSIVGKPATVNGTMKIITAAGTYYVTTGTAPRLVRVESTGLPSYSLDVAETPDATADLRTDVAALKDSFDPGVDSLKADPKGTCSSSGCDVSATISAARGSRASIPITVFFWVTYDSVTGSRAGACNSSVEVTSDASVKASCRVSASGLGSRTAWVHLVPVAGGATSAEIQTMLDGISHE